MITSKDCWLKNTCKKYNSSKECACRSNDIFCIKLFKLDELYNIANMSMVQRTKKDLILDADKCDKDAYSELKNFCENIEQNVKSGYNIYIYSSITGNGKTAWAEKIIQSYINSIWYKANLEPPVVLFVSVPSYLIAMKDNISNRNEYFNYIKENAIKADLVIWDDIATKGMTQFEHDNLLAIIDQRMLLNKSNVFTSNIYPEDLEDYLGPRLTSRIRQLSKCIEFKGKDKRGINK